MTDAAGEKLFNTQPDSNQLTDPQLLARYVSGRDAAAFEALVRRHGPMVMGVCRRVLRDANDAEDAFQATFLVLIRKAQAIAKPELLANWLYGVACHKSLKARTSAGRRRVHERPMVDAVPAPARDPDRDRDLWLDLQPMLDEELSNLPDKYRAPVVLCDLEGKTIQDAAALLDCPQGTLASRLTKARNMLAQQLTRRGLILSTATVSVLLAQNAASASVPESSVQAMLSVAASTPAPSPSLIPFPGWLANLLPATWTATSAARIKLITAVVLAFGAGTLSLVKPTNVVEEKKSKSREQVDQANAATPKSQPPVLNGDFIVAAGEYKLFNDAIALKAWDDQGELKWSLTVPPNSPPTSANGRTEATKTKFDSAWFIFPESPERFWQFDGKGTLSLHSYKFKEPKPDDDRTKLTTFVSSEMATSRVDITHQQELLKLLPPKPVLQRLQPWMRPGGAVIPATDAVLRDGYIVKVGEYKFFKGTTQVKVWEDDKGLIVCSVSQPAHVSDGVWSATSNLKRRSRWRIYPESPERFWSFDGASTVTSHAVEFQRVKAKQDEKLVETVQAKVSTRTAKLPEQLRDFLSWDPPKVVRRWIPRPPGPLVTEIGEYSLFDDDALIKVWEEKGKIHCSATWTYEFDGDKGSGTTTVGAGTSAKPESAWCFYPEAPESLWFFDGTSEIILFKRGVHQPDAPPFINGAALRAKLPDWSSLSDYADPPDALLQRLPAALRPQQR